MFSRVFRSLVPSLQGRLSVLLATLLLLGALLSSWLIWQGHRNERRAMERHLSDAAYAVATIMEGEFARHRALLQGLSVSSRLITGDLAAFHRQARNATNGRKEWIVLLDSKGNQLLNTRVDYGTSLPGIALGPGATEALSEGDPHRDKLLVSNLQLGPLVGGYVFAIAIPFRSAQGDMRALCLVTTPRDFTDPLLIHRMGEDWLMSVVDRNLRIAGRNRRPDEFIGKTASATIAALLSERTHGVVETVTLDGIPSITAFHRAPNSGWSVIVAAPKAQLFDGAWALTLQALAVALAAGALAIFFSLWAGRSIITGVRTLVDASSSLAKARPLRPASTGIREIDLVSRALSESSDALAARETALARARDEALAASRAKDEFLAALSHELRTPLNPVLLLASDGARDTALPPGVRDTFSTIARNVTTEARLIDDLLDITRIGTGKISLHLQSVSLDQLLGETIETFRHLFVEKSIQPVIELTCADARVMGDVTRLQQVFWNLLNNACKFTPHGGRIHIRSRVDAAARRMVVEITDNGHGMTPSEIARVFERFMQGDHASTSARSEFGGLGLGLVIARDLVALHHGTIAAASPGRNQGSTFTVSLPLASTTGQLPAASSVVLQPAVAAPAKRILLVEDHKPTLVTMEKLLARRGHTVAAAATAADALNHAAGARFDFVISDIGLPDRDGCDLMRELREKHGLHGIAMSGHGTEGDRARAGNAGFHIHLTKPVNIEMLDEAIRQISQG